MAFLIGQCANIPVTGNPGNGSNGGGTTPGGITGGGTVVVSASLNEQVLFTNVATLSIAWNATRKARFGDSGSFYTELLMPDGKYRPVLIEAIPDSITNTTRYDFDFGGPSSGRITID